MLKITILIDQNFNKGKTLNQNSSGIYKRIAKVAFTELLKNG